MTRSFIDRRNANLRNELGVVLRQRNSAHVLRQNSRLDVRLVRQHLSREEAGEKEGGGGRWRTGMLGVMILAAAATHSGLTQPTSRLYRNDTSYHSK